MKKHPMILDWENQLKNGSGTLIENPQNQKKWKKWLINI